MAHLGTNESPAPRVSESGAPPLTLAGLFKQLSLSVKGAYHFVRHPTSRQTFTALSEGLVRFRSNHEAVAYMLRDPRVAQLCRERYVGRPYILDELMRYPAGSLGHELAASMIAHGFDPEFYRDYYGTGPLHFKNDEEWVRFRTRQMHDLVHVLTGFGATDFPEELGMQAFLAAQTRRPFSIALVGFGMLRIVLQPRELALTLHQVAKGFAMGYSAEPLIAYRFEEEWAKPVEEWRRRLNLVEESAFDFRAANVASVPGARPEEPRSNSVAVGAGE
jgi:ubiquinone biosynthesis protein COQ4